MMNILWGGICGLLVIFFAFATQTNLFGQNVNGYAILFAALFIMFRIQDLDHKLSHIVRER